ncbi:MAG: hypothetical protein QXH12_04620 [Candidatus Caldarchaeum sp.]
MRQFPFNASNLEDCFSKIQLPKIDSYPNHVFIIASVVPVMLMPVALWDAGFG